MIDFIAGSDLELLRGRTIAVASGKGGVGKTTTAANLAVYCARKGLKTAILDLDPLSDITSLFDLSEPGEDLDTGRGKSPSNLDDLILTLGRNLILLVPEAKLGRPTAAGLIRTLYTTFRKELEERFDIIILDLPAGESFEDNIMFIPLAEILILVTNPEPTSHVSAGGYMKKVFEYDPDRIMWTWHNKYEPISSLTFTPDRIAENYNRNVVEEMHLTPEEMERIRDIAFIPPDPSLDLLKTNPGFGTLVLRKTVDLLSYLMEHMIKESTEGSTLSPRVLEVLIYYFDRNPVIGDADTYLAELGSYLRNTLMDRASVDEGTLPSYEGVEVFSPEEKKDLSEILERLKNQPLRRDISRIITILNDELAGTHPEKNRQKTIDRELTQLLMKLNGKSRSSRSYQQPGGILLFYFGLYKLLQTEVFRKALDEFIPRKLVRKKVQQRDRFKQISNLIDRDGDYRKAFLQLIKALYPAVEKQLTNTVSVLNIPHLLYTQDHRINTRAYAKLLTTFVHDAVYSGLGIIVGFEYRSAALAFQQGADTVLSMIGA